MNKQLIFALTLAAVSVFAGTATEAAEVKQATAVYGTAKIDAVKDGIYDSVTPIITDTLVSGYPNPNGSKATVWYVWDYDGLSVYAEVVEETPNDAGGEGYQVDGVEIFLDENNSKSATLDTDDAQYRVTMTGRTEVGMYGVESFASAARSMSGKYAVEMKLPWNGKIPDDGTIIGFNVAVNDGKDNGLRDNVTQWNSDTKTGYKDTSNYGELTLINGGGYAPYDGKNRPLHIELNNKLMICDEAPPVIVNDRTLVPMRVLFEAFDTAFSWNDATKTVYAIRNGALFEIPIGSPEVKVNGESVLLDVPASIINDRTMVPVRFVAENLGLTVEYDGYKGIIYITGEL